MLGSVVTPVDSPTSPNGGESHGSSFFFPPALGTGSEVDLLRDAMRDVLLVVEIYSQQSEVELCFVCGRCALWGRYPFLLEFEFLDMFARLLVRTF